MYISMQNISFIAHHFASLFQIMSINFFPGGHTIFRAVITRAVLVLGFGVTQNNDLNGTNR